MTNRLRKSLRTFSCCVGLLISLTCFSRLNAQSSFFTFNYNGPDTLVVGVGCTNALQGSIPNPIVSSTIGATIITSMFDVAQSGFAYNATFIAGEIAHVYWLVEDNMGHAFTFEYFIFFVDNTPPAFDLTGINDTVFFNSIVQVPPPPFVAIMDNCSGFTQTYAETAYPDTCEAGQFTRTWTATDMAGNTATFTQTVIIAADVSPPTIIFGPQNGSSACEVLATAYPAWLAAQMLAFTANDPSGIKSLTNNGPASFPPGCKVPLTVTFKATDNCNIMLPTTAVFTTSDTQGPVVTVAPKDTIAYCSPGGNQLTKLNEWIHTHAYMQVTDACSPPLTFIMQVNGTNSDSAAVVAAFLASFANSCGTQLIGSQIVNDVSALVRVDYFVSDACGNQTFAGQAMFGAVDTLPPVITGVNTTEECGGGNDQTALQNWINAKGNASISDDCSTASWTNFSFTSSDAQTGSGTFNAGPYPNVQANNCAWLSDVTFHASDECGNSSSKTLRFQIIDTQPPVFSGLAPNITVYCPNPLPTVPAATITDNCDLIATTSFTRVYKDSICDGSYTVLTTWRATDDCGNSSTITQNIFVRDTTRPVFTLVPIGLLMRCDTFALPPVPVQGVNINATDLCSPVVSISTATVSFQNPSTTNCGHYSYTISRIFTATDECGNTKTATQLISVIDNQPPIPSGLLDTTALCSDLLPFPAPPPSAFDICAGPILPPVYVDTDTIPGSCMGQYTLKLNWVATDYCGNHTEFAQTVHVVDTVAPTLTNLPPNITVECDAIPGAPNSSTFNGADNCASSVAVNLVQSEIRNPNPDSCDHWTNYIVRREWTATDACGNARTYTQDIQIEDTTPPALAAPATLTLSNDLDDCGASVAIPAPLSVSDICTSVSNMVLLKDTLPILPLFNGTNGNIPVDTMVFHFATPNLPPNQPAITNVSLSIFIERADAEGTMEFFKIFGEKGTFINNTNPTPGQCSATPGMTTVTITAAQFNDWASDGDLVITLAPNGTGGNAINPVCPNSQVCMQIGYSYATPQVPIVITYTLDGGPSASFPPAGTTFLGIGSHTVVYTAADCAGNSSTASAQIVVNDTQAPIIAMPAPMTAYVGPGNCNSTITLPFPVITENCEMSGHLAKSSAFLPINFISNPNAPDFVPANTTMGISGLIPNAIANGTLRIKFKGQNDGPREFFNIFHNALLLDTTEFGTPAGQCQDTVVTTRTVTPAQINSWAASGTAIFRAEANTNPGPTFDFDFINPCVPLLPNQTDGISRIQAMLEYSYAIVNFTVFQGITVKATGALQGTQTMVVLPPGSYIVKYTTTDNAGLMGMTTFPLVVLDTIKPVAVCKPSLIINVNPSGVNNYTLQPSEINDGSQDNCTGTNLNYSLSQNTFSCSQAGSNFIVTLTVTDTSGNSATCATVVSVQNDAPMPYANPVCEGDTLQLFANPPSPGTFSYLWTGPSFSSTDQNPIRLLALPAFQGLYTVKITGATGCTATGSVTVNFANLTVPVITVSGGAGTNFCQGQTITLNTLTNPAPNVTYQWYLNAPIPQLLTTTMLNTYTIAPPMPGVYQYFVKVKIGECLTPNSSIITVNVFARPLAIVEDDKIIVCAGEPLAFGTAVSGPGLTYQWSGPGWPGSNLQFPLVSSAATQAFNGIHTLKTFQNGCESVQPDTILVTVKYTPPQPQILGPMNVCVGNKVVLKAVTAGTPSPDFYEWEDPSLNIIVTNNIDSLVVQNVDATHCGGWRVRARYQNCFSPWSNPFNFCPDAYPVVTAGSNSPICQDSTLRLTATGSIGSLNWCWTFPNAQQLFQQNPVITPGLPGLYQVVGKTSQGCADTATVLVLGSIAPVIAFIENTAPVCADGITDACLIPTFSSLDTPFTYSWTSNGTFVSSDLTLCFPDVGPAQNGPYTFVVKDKYGCPSAPSTATINVQAQVATPQLLISPNPVCVGNSVTLSLGNTYNGGPQYHWINPQQDTITTTGPQLVLLGVSLAQGGNYNVYVSQGACASPLSNTVTLVVNPIPPTPIPISNQPVCVGSILQFDVSNPIDGARYSWSGPAAFIDTIRNPLRHNVSLSYEGTYTVQVAVAGCVSAPSTIQVDVVELPKKPVIDPADLSPICLEQLPITGFLRVTQSSQTFNATYTWLDNASKDTILSIPPPYMPLNYASLPDSLLTPGLHSFQVVAWKDGCSSPLSDSVVVRFDTIPANVAQCDPDHAACASPTIPILLNAVTPSGNIVGEWSLFSGPNVQIFNLNDPTTGFIGVAGNTYTFTWSLSSGGCKNFSVDTLVINAEAPEKAHAGVDTVLCNASEFALYATQGQFSSGTWSQMGQNTTIADPQEPNTPVTGLDPGNRYFFVWTLDNIGCGAAKDTVMVSYFSGKPNITGALFVCTGEDCTPLQSQGIQSWETGAWSSSTTLLTFNPANGSSTNVCDLVPGPNTVYWTINSGACGGNSRDTFVVNYEIFPQANPDVVMVDFGGSVNIDVLTNDILPTDPPAVTIIVQPASGTIIGNPTNGTYVYRPLSGFSGTDVFIYKICNVRCGENACATATVTINVGEAGDCYVPTIITPNGDDLNDAFRLPPECYLVGEGEAIIEVTIFNQWGDFVYHQKPFVQNVDAWDGKKAGEELPAGTYYYVVKFEGVENPKAGFILLQR
jgi:gliding motility-associated-like protein